MPIIQLGKVCFSDEDRLILAPFLGRFHNRSKTPSGGSQAEGPSGSGATKDGEAPQVGKADSLASLAEEGAAALTGWIH